MRNEAENIVKAMDYLPLALDQAGGYIDTNHISLSEYYEFYQKNSMQLLDQRGALPVSTGHADPVATTFSISYDQVKKANPDVADLLSFCAFLAPDDIPVGLVTDGIPDFDNSKISDAIEVLQRYSLIQYDPETNSISINRLVQVFITNAIDEHQRPEWAKMAVRAVYRVFPEQVNQETWDMCSKYLSQAIASADLIEQYDFTFREAGLLLNRAGAYQFQLQRLEQAEKLNNQSLALQEKILKEKKS
jgi:hypothetical protein